MGQSESSFGSRLRSPSVTPSTTPSRQHLSPAHLHHPPMASSSAGGGLLDVPKPKKANSSRRSSDLGDDIIRMRNRQRSPSPHKLALPKMDNVRRRLSADENCGASSTVAGAISRKNIKQQEIFVNLLLQDEFKGAKSKQRRKSKDASAALPLMHLPAGLMGSKRSRMPVKLEDYFTVPEIPAEEIFKPFQESDEEDGDDATKALFPGPSSLNARRSRRRATSINPTVETQRQIEMAVKKSKRNHLLVPTVFKYHFKSSSVGSALKNPPTHVYLAGSMTNWRSREMATLKDESYFVSIIDCLPGKYYYKFWVDGNWCHDESQPLIISKDEVKANVMTVRMEDREVFEALACDSFATKKQEACKFSSVDGWSQEEPTYEDIGPRQYNPPFLPPHLSQNNVLNKLSITKAEPCLLPEPTSHVTMHHLYAQSIKENLLVLATTTRFKKKCVTIIYYKPIAD